MTNRPNSTPDLTQEERKIAALAWDQGFLARGDSTYDNTAKNPYRQ